MIEKTLWLGQGGQIYPEDSVPEPSRQSLGDLDGQTRLSDTRRPCQRDQPCVTEHLLHSLQLVLARDVAGERLWYSMNWSRIARNVQESLVLEENPLFQLSQPWRWLDTELLTQ